MKPQDGTIKFNGDDTKKLTTADMARHAGYVFQNPDRQMFRDTVAQEVAYGPEQLGFSTERIKQAVADALEVTGLTDLAAAYPLSLSKGQKQRVAIASALSMEPRLLILDEPTSGQDAQERESLMQLLAKLNDTGITILLVTHDMEILARYGRRVIVMAAGEKVFDGSVTDLFSGKYDVKAWGLTEPVAARISREMTELGINQTITVGELTDNIYKIIRGERYA